MGQGAQARWQGAVGASPQPVLAVQARLSRASSARLCRAQKVASAGRRAQASQLGVSDEVSFCQLFFRHSRISHIYSLRL